MALAQNVKNLDPGVIETFAAALRSFPPASEFSDEKMDEVTLWWMEQDVPVWVRLLVAAGIGFLVGLEREFAKQVREPGMGSNGRLGHQFAGLRTYTLITLFGFLAALLADEWGVWL